MLAKLPHYLTVSRHGIFYLRVTRKGKEYRCSLKTRDPNVARAAAYRFGATIGSMKIDTTKIKNWTLETDGNNLKVTTEDSDSDRQGAIEALLAFAAIHYPNKSTNLVTVSTHTAQVHTSVLPMPNYPLTVKEGTEAWQNSRNSEIKFKSIQAYNTYTKKLIYVFGARQIHTVSPQEISEALNVLKTKLNIKTVQAYASGWRLCWKWFVDYEHALTNPVKIPKISAAKAAEIS